ncbi:unnamed protein product [Effrenium voratum]|nr:unnamed protein product [Effrenium voratum]
MAGSSEELEVRHEREEQELEERGKKHIEDVTAAAGKGKKAKQVIEAAEREVEQWLYELRERHKEELEEVVPQEAKSEEEESKVDKVSPEEDEAEKARKKKEKAQKKRQAKADKEAQKEADKEREKREAGPSARELELTALAAALTKQKPPLEVLEIPSDGHCLYRSVADQLRRFTHHEFTESADERYKEVRKICAESLRSQVENYSPFAELKEGEDFEGYCRRVESSADWGGELELRALADALKVRILVFQAGAEPLVLGEPKAKTKLQVSFHRHYYALGEHYNSVVSTYHMPCDFSHMQVMVIHASLAAGCAYEFAGDLPLILAGDFNFRPGSAPYELLTTGSLHKESTWTIREPSRAGAWPARAKS